MVATIDAHSATCLWTSRLLCLGRLRFLSGKFIKKTSKRTVLRLDPIFFTDKTRKWFEPGACFAAGTLVHTKQGLVPIEQVKVGDWVLSKPENGGEQAYKRVLQAFAHAQERVVRQGYYIPAKNPNKNGGNVGVITCTLNHPFWVKELGWTAASELSGRGAKAVHFEDLHGEDIPSSPLRNVYISDQPNVGWIPSRMGQVDDLGYMWDYANHKLVDTDVLALEPIRHYEHPDPFLKLPVYNLEVEDFHTYYVGEHGIWVHNQNCGGLNFEVRNTPNPIKLARVLSFVLARMTFCRMSRALAVQMKGFGSSL